MSRRKGQTAIEFLILMGFMLVVFSGFALVIKERAAIASQEARQNELEAVADALYLEVSNANRVNNGYSRTFELPQLLAGEPYQIMVSDKSELMIKTAEEEYLLFLPVNVTVVDTGGAQATTLVPGENTMTKTDGNITITVPAGQDEWVTCKFPDLAAGTARCFSSQGHTCTGTADAKLCTLRLSALAGTALTWTSTCTGSGATTVDGTDEEVVFSCPDVTERVTCVFLDNPASGSNVCKLEDEPTRQCTGTSSCSLDVTRTTGSSVTIISSCRGTNTLVLSGANPQASFFCRNT